jgi:hypothetical protein
MQTGGTSSQPGASPAPVSTRASSTSVTSMVSERRRARIAAARVTPGRPCSPGVTPLGWAGPSPRDGRQPPRSVHSGPPRRNERGMVISSVSTLSGNSSSSAPASARPSSASASLIDGASLSAWSRVSLA